MRSRRLAALFLAVAASASDQQPRAARDDGWVAFDPVYLDLAASTGGDFYFWVPGEMARHDAMLSLDRTLLLLGYGELDGGVRELDVPVDGAVSRVRFQAGMAGPGRVVLLDPSGRPPQPGPGVRLELTSHMLLCTIDAPAPGGWKLRLEGEGSFAATATARSVLYLEGVQVEEGSREGSIGPRVARVRLGKGYETAEVVLLGRDGSLVARAATTSTAPGMLTAELPAAGVPFRIAVEGEDVQGQRFRRVDGRLQRSRTLSVAPADGATVVRLRAGRPARIAFVVTNHASLAQQVDVRAIDGSGSSLPVEPAVLVLEAGAILPVEVVVALPIVRPPANAASKQEGSAGGTPQGSLLVSATASSDPGDAGFSEVAIVVDGAADPQ